MTHSIRVLRLAVVVGLLAGCGETSPRPSVSQVLVAPGAATISVHESLRIVATVTTSPSGSAYAVTWTTSDPAFATVDSTGLAVGIAASPGVSICATVATASGNSSVKSCSTVVVVPAPVCPGPNGLLIPSLDTMHVGDVAQFQIPAAQLSGRSPGEIRWTLDSAGLALETPAPASIDSLTGVVTAMSAGGADVVATDPLLGSPCPHDWHAIVIVIAR